VCRRPRVSTPGTGRIIGVYVMIAVGIISACDRITRAETADAA